MSKEHATQEERALQEIPSRTVWENPNTPNTLKFLFIKFSEFETFYYI